VVDERIDLRWVTWWPASYWIPRFNALAASDVFDFTAVFMSSDQVYYSWDFDSADWRFRHEALHHGATSIGFYRPGHRLLDVRPVVRAVDHRTRIIMPYSDPSTFALAALARARRIPYFVFSPNTPADQRHGGWMRERLKRLIFGGATGVITTGELQAGYAAQYADVARIHVIGNPIDGSAFRSAADNVRKRRDQLRASLGLTGRFVLGYVGRLAPEKRIDTLIRAAALLPADQQPVVLVGGDGPCRADLEALSTELGVDFVVRGFVDGDRLIETYVAADVFVLPSVSEPWGLVVNEAMECGVPTVVSDNVGSRHLVESGGGAIFRAGDAGDLARAALRFAAADDREASSEQARRRVALESIDSWLARLHDALAVPHSGTALKNFS
jgi:glycosyltransferase involved in cell wall biosynthesis